MGGCTFSGPEDERNAFPSWVVDPKSCGSERGTGGILRDRGVVKITRLLICANVLAEKRILRLDGRDCAENFDLSRPARQSRIQEADGMHAVTSVPFHHGYPQLRMIRVSPSSGCSALGGDLADSET
jgi:hypothetical protein